MTYSETIKRNEGLINSFVDFLESENISKPSKDKIFIEIGRLSYENKMLKSMPQRSDVQIETLEIRLPSKFNFKTK